jgi:hypothetical protein
MNLVNAIGGGAVVFFIVTMYVVGIALGMVVLYRIAILLPALTKLVERHAAQLPSKDNKISINQRLLELEDLQRLGRISQQEYESMREEILDEV